MATVDDRVKQIIVEQLGVDEGKVTSNASFVDDLGADSLDTVELVLAFEERGCGLVSRRCLCTSTISPLAPSRSMAAPMCMMW
jgi:hypothetical protein